MHSTIGTGMAADTGGTAGAVVINCVGLLDEAKLVLEEVGLLRPGLLLLMIVGEGGCCFFFTA